MQTKGELIHAPVEFNSGGHNQFRCGTWCGRAQIRHKISNGEIHFVANAGDARTNRVVQQVAAEPCNIRMRAQRGNNGAIEVVTDPIRDCSGNAVPDGTIVTFTAVDSNGRSTVDSRIKRGIAQAELPASSSALISVAAGVVMGNEIHWGGK